MRETNKAQMQANFEAVFRHYNLPVPRLLITIEDRCFWRCDLDFLSKLQGNKGFDPWPLYRHHGSATRDSWRERAPAMSMQIVQHGELPDDVMIETDFDLYNPDWGLYYMGLHLVRDVVLRWKPTPRQIAERLRKRGILVEEVAHEHPY